MQMKSLRTEQNRFEGCRQKGADEEPYLTNGFPQITHLVCRLLCTEHSVGLHHMLFLEGGAVDILLARVHCPGVLLC